MSRLSAAGEATRQDGLPEARTLELQVFRRDAGVTERLQQLDCRVLREMQLVPVGRLRGHAALRSVVIGRVDAAQPLEIRVCRFQSHAVAPGTGRDRYVRCRNRHASGTGAARKLVGG